MIQSVFCFRSLGEQPPSLEHYDKLQERERSSKLNRSWLFTTISPHIPSSGPSIFHLIHKDTLSQPLANQIDIHSSYNTTSRTCTSKQDPFPCHHSQPTSLIPTTTNALFTDIDFKTLQLTTVDNLTPRNISSQRRPPLYPSLILQRTRSLELRMGNR
jgi:hypothetical protein